MNTDIPQAERTKQGIANGMQQNVRVTVPHGSFVMRDVYSADPKITPFSQLVKINT
jgi:hypothetical protein